MKTVAKTLMVALGLALAYVATPEAASAQCITPQHCHNIPNESEQQCFDGLTSFSFEICYIAGGMCQMSGRCGMAYLDLEGDVNLTPAGTLASPSVANVLAAFSGEELKNCRDFVILVAKRETAAPSQLVLD